LLLAFDLILSHVSPCLLASESSAFLSESIEHLQAGRKQDALTAARLAYETADSDGSKNRAALVTGQVLVQLGFPIEAEDVLTEILKRVESGSMLDLEIENELGAVWNLRGEYKTAAEHYEKALDIAIKQRVNADKRARIIINLATAELDTGRAPRLSDRLLRLHTWLEEENVSIPVQISSAILLRRAEREFGEPESLREKASNLLVLAQKRAHRSGDLRSESLAIGVQAMLYRDEGRLDESLRLTEIALLHAQESNSLETVYRWHAQIGEILLEKNDRDAAREAFEQAVAILSEIKSDLPASSPRMFSERVMPVYGGLADVVLQQARIEKPGPAQQRLLREVVNSLEDLKKAEVEDYFSKECVVETSQDMSTMLADSAIIYPVFLPGRTEILLETRDGLHQFVIDVGKAEITDVIRELRTELEDYGLSEDYYDNAELLEEWLIDPMEPVLEDLEIKTLVFIPDGPLRTIPMAALYDGEQFLIERYALASTPAISLTRANIDRERNALIGGITEGVQGFSPLSFVGPELEQVSQILQGPKLQDRSFGLANIQSKFSEADYSVVHFATHGLFSSDFRNSFLLAHDDKFTMSRLEQALGGQQGLDLLVLSACETAAGDDRAALGLAGVAIQAGAESALASLWSISDEGTAELIPVFYEHLYSGGKSKAESLRLAQIKLLRDPRFDHPVFWAPYILIGNWL